MLTLIDFRPILEAKGVKHPQNWLIEHGISRKTAYSLLNGKLLLVRLSYLEKLCEALQCNITEILEWKPDLADGNPDTHPLESLRKEKLDLTSQKKIRKMSVAQLKKLKDFVDGL